MLLAVLLSENTECSANVHRLCFTHVVAQDALNQPRHFYSIAHAVNSCQIQNNATAVHLQEACMALLPSHLRDSLVTAPHSTTCYQLSAMCQGSHKLDTSHKITRSTLVVLTRCTPAAVTGCPPLQNSGSSHLCSWPLAALSAHHIQPQVTHPRTAPYGS